MPFDGLVAPRTDHFTHCSIDLLLAAYGIEAVPKAVLDKHKEDQIRRHPPSLFYQHRWLHRLLVLLAFAGAIASVAVFMAHDLATPAPIAIAALVVGTICLPATVWLSCFTRIKRPAAWRESPISVNSVTDRSTLPASILKLVDQIGGASTSVQFAVGTLYQEQVALDPYIMAEKFDFNTMTRTSACLGIWDGDEILHIAKQS